MDVVIDLITKYKCDANCKDFKRKIFHYTYASAGGHLEVVKYLINEQHCDPMSTKVQMEQIHHFTMLFEFGRLNIVQYIHQ